MGKDNHGWHLDLSYDQWVSVAISGAQPAARYKHAAAVDEDELYITGGSRNGRHLSDIQVLNLRSLSWSTIKLNAESAGVKTEEYVHLETLPAISSHSMIKWGNRLLLVAGQSKDGFESTAVRFINLETHQSGFLETFGTTPVARSGQSVTLFGSKLIMFGGEDRGRKLLNDVQVLDLETMAWSSMETQTPPGPRFDHSAAMHEDRYLMIFGGCSHSKFFSDLHILDFETMEWSQQQLQGDLVLPRAGHAGVAINENWYITGGGDNKSGSAETLLINMSNLVVSVLTSVKGRDPMASEGLSVSSTVLDNEILLVAFGGYNGKYSNEVFVMRLRPRDNHSPDILQSYAAADAAASVTAAYTLAGEAAVSESEDSNFKEVQKNGYQQDFSIEIGSIREEKKILESALAEVTSENLALKEKIEDVNGTFSDMSKELHSVKGHLIDERSRCAKLEAQISELQKKQESMQSIEEEVQELRSEKDAFVHDLELSASEQQSSGGIWRWISG